MFEGTRFTLSLSTLREHLSVRSDQPTDLSQLDSTPTPTDCQVAYIASRHIV